MPAPFQRRCRALFLFGKSLQSHIPFEVVDPDDIEMLEDLIMAATNEALRKVDEETNAVMSKLTGGLGMGGGFPF